MRFQMPFLFAVVLVTGWNHTATAVAPIVARKPNLLRTYRFTAKIVHNGGVTPFKVGTKLTGEFTYDLGAPNFSKLKWAAGYRSSRNTVEIHYGQLVFRSQGVVSVTVGLLENRIEGFTISGGKVSSPKGWRVKHDSSSGKDYSSISLSLSNDRPRGVLRSTALPKRLDSWKRFSLRVVRLNFTDGLVFPGGSVEKGGLRALVLGQLESLKRVQPKDLDAKKSR